MSSRPDMNTVLREAAAEQRRVLPPSLARALDPEGEAAKPAQAAQAPPADPPPTPDPEPPPPALDQVLRDALGRFRAPRHGIAPVGGDDPTPPSTGPADAGTGSRGEHDPEPWAGDMNVLIREQHGIDPLSGVELARPWQSPWH